ncbi:hypothetical protein [Novipirellula rosea]
MITCSVFLHHDDDPVTRDHFARLQRFSSGPTVAVSSATPLATGESIADFSHSLWRAQVEQRPKLKAKSTDLLLIDWFRNRRVSADRYFIVEWDTLVNQSIDDLLLPVTQFPLAAPSIRLSHREPEWFRRQRPHIPADLRPLATGMVPFSCIMVSHAVLNQIAMLYTEDLMGLGEVTGELRFATLAARCGITPVSIPSLHRVTWMPFRPIGLGATIYHPVKLPYVDPHPWMEADEIAALESLLQPHFHVLEYGCGHSTFWLADRVAKVTTVEHNSKWLARVTPFPPNVEVLFAPPAWPCPKFGPAEPGQFEDYIHAATDRTPDLVLVDGRARVPACRHWASRTPTILHDAHRSRYGELRKQFLAGSLARILPEESPNETQ